MSEITAPEKSKASASDHLANERTFLAWIRTSIAMMGFGFVVVKFTLFIKQLSLVITDHVVLPGKGYSSVIGVSLVALGALIALFSFIRYRITERQLADKIYAPSYMLTLLVTTTIVVISVLLIIYLLPGL
jgi:putative membrane protein